MEIRCSQCQHLGPAAEVRPTTDGVALVCANCGHLNTLEVPGGEAGEAPPSPPAAKPTVAEADTSGESSWLKPDALRKLLPSAGSGPRCRKCANLLDEEDDHCPRCGLSVIAGERHSDGDAPWERPPEGREGEHEQASLLWKAVEDNPTDENVTKFANFARDEKLLEYAIQRLRFFLVENPGNDGATRHLNELAQAFQSKMIIAQAQAQVRAGNVLEHTGKMKNVLLWVVFLIWVGVFVVFASQFTSATGCGG